MQPRDNNAVTRAAPLAAITLGLALSLTSVSGTQAMTCRPDPRAFGEPNTPAIDLAMTRQMYDAATYVDVAVATEARPLQRLTLSDRWWLMREWLGSWRSQRGQDRQVAQRKSHAARYQRMFGSNLGGAGPSIPAPVMDERVWVNSWTAPRLSTIRYQSVERIKGEGARTFDLQGLATSEYFHPGWGLRFPLRPLATDPPVSHIRVAQTFEPSLDDSVYEVRGAALERFSRDWGLPSCSPQTRPLQASRGIQYLVFRDAKGRLLRGPHDREMPSYRPVNEPSPWLAAARLARR